MSQATKIRLVIVDDHEVVLEGLKALFDGTSIEVLGTEQKPKTCVPACSQMSCCLIFVYRAVKTACH